MEITNVIKRVFKHVRREITVDNILKGMLVFDVVFANIVLMFSIVIWNFQFWYDLLEPFVFVPCLIVSILFTFIAIFTLQYLFQE